MLLGIKVAICYVMHQYATAKSKYMKGYKKDKESSFVMSSNLCRWAISQILPDPSLERRETHQSLMKS